VERGGADAGGYGEAGCTHVVVFGLVYVSPIPIPPPSSPPPVVSFVGGVTRALSSFAGVDG
jgi:hypothetical protein